MSVSNIQMAEFPALPLFTDAFIGDTLHLNTAQVGAYMLMLMTAWRAHDCALPNDDILLARICRMDKRTWATNKEVLLTFWCVDDTKLFQKRLRDERNYVEQLRNKNSQAGKASALKRLNRGSTTVGTTVQPEFNPHTHTLPISKKKPNIELGKKEKVSLEDLSVDHNAEWLAKKRVGGKYQLHDENFILEQFKQYCEAKGKTYENYLSAYRNAFEWEKCQPKTEQMAAYIGSAGANTPRRNFQAPLTATERDKLARSGIKTLY